MKMIKIPGLKFLLVLMALVLWDSNTEAFSDQPFLGQSNELFADAPLTAESDRPQEETGKDPTIRRSRKVEINFDLLDPQAFSPSPQLNTPMLSASSTTIPADTFALNLFSDINMTVIKDRVERRSMNHYTWYGHIEGEEESQVILVVEEGNIAGNIMLAGTMYQIRDLAGLGPMIYEIDQNALPPHADPISLDVPEPPLETLVEALGPPTASCCDTGSTIDVMVVYTAAASAAVNNIAADIQLAIDVTNTAYANSLINQRLRLVHTAQITYTETGDSRTDLLRLQNPTDGFMDEVHALRDTHRADVVSLFVESSGGGVLGIAFVMTRVSPTFESLAFSVVQRQFATPRAFAHELGHNMGALHDRANSSVQDGAFSYSFGYQAPDRSFRTIMAYPCTGGFCPAVSHFSTPLVTFEGVPTGVLEGNPDSADNTKTLNNTAATVAGFRQSVTTPPPDTTPPLTLPSSPGGIYASAQSISLSCTDADSGCAATYYTTNGATPTATSTQYGAPIPIFSDTTLKFFSIDLAGNPEAVRTEIYTIDGVSPLTTVSAAGGIYASAQSISLSCTDADSGCAATYYTTNGATPTTTSTRYSVPISISSNTHLKFFSVDDVGNSEPVKIEVYVIDTKTPLSSASPVAGAYRSPQTVRLGCADSNTGCAVTYFSTNGATPTTASSQYTGPITLSGNTTLKFFSIDNAGNNETVQSQVYTFSWGLTVVKTGNGGGTVLSQLPGIDCGVDCSETYADASIETLKAAPNKMSHFIGWGDVCTGSGDCTLNLIADQSVTATFVLLPISTTGAVRKLTETSASLAGFANAKGGVGSAWFEYGITTAYGDSTPSQSISGDTNITISQEITGLSGGTLYHYRFCLQTSGPAVCGLDASFSTRAAILGAVGNISLLVPATASRIDGYDLIVMGNALGSDPSKPNWNPLADLNGDSVIDEKDFSILSLNFGKAQ